MSVITLQARHSFIVSSTVEKMERERVMSKWELKEDSDVSWWHCGRAGYWEGDDVYCSKCQTKLQEVA